MKGITLKKIIIITAIAFSTTSFADFSWFRDFIASRNTSSSSNNSSTGTVSINFYVLQESNGSGNSQWLDASYVRSVVNSANEQSGSTLFKVGSIVRVKNSSLFRKSQPSLLSTARRYAGTGKISVVISKPNTRYGGYAQIRYNSTSPNFVMRSRNNSRSNYKLAGSISDTARIFLHELGHQMKLKHSGRVNTDNHYRVARKKLKQFIGRVRGSSGGNSTIPWFFRR